MPDYEVTDNKTGKTYVFSGDSPPTEAEIMMELGRLQSPSSPQSFLERMQSQPMPMPEGASMQPPIGSEGDTSAKDAFNKFVVEQGPVIGATLLSLLGRGKGLSGVASRTGYAGAGGTVGELFKQYMSPQVGATYKGAYPEKEGLLSGAPLADPELASKERANSGLMAMLSQILGEGAVSGIGKAIAPGASKMTESGRNLMNLSKEKGMAIPPSEIVPTAPARALENVSDFFLPGRVVKHGMEGKTFKKLQTELDDFMGKAGTTKSAAEVGEETVRGVDKAIENFWEQSSMLYKQEFLGNAEALSVTGGPIPINRTKEVVAKIAENEKVKLEIVQDPKFEKFFKDFQEKFSKEENISPKDWHDLYKAVNKTHFEKWEEIIKPIKGAMEKDLKDWVEPQGADYIVNVLTKANNHYIEGMENLIDNPGIKRMFTDPRMNHPPAQAIVSSLMNPGNKQLWNTLQDKLSPELVANIKQRYLSNLFDETSPVGKNILKELNANQKYIDGGALTRYLNANKETINSNFDKATIDSLYGLAALSKAAMKNVDVFKAGSFGGVLGMGNIGALVMLGNYAPISTAVTIGTAPFIAHSIMSPKGFLKTWLTEGLLRGPSGKLIRSGAKEPLKLGGRELMMGQND